MVGRRKAAVYKYHDTSIQMPQRIIGFGDPQQHERAGVTTARRGASDNALQKPREYEYRFTAYQGRPEARPALLLRGELPQALTRAIDRPPVTNV